MKIERLLGILMLLLNRSLVTAKEMAERFHVSKRTIYRDIISLEQAGFPIIAIYGNEGGYQLMPEFKLHTYTFSETEKHCLVQALHMQAELFTETEMIRAIREKLQILMVEEQNITFTVNQGTLHRPEIEQQVSEKLQILQAQINNHKKIQLDYIDANGSQTSRIVSPKKLYLRNGSWYIQAYCDLRQEKREFKLTRIRKIMPLDLINTIEMTDEFMDNHETFQTVVLHFHRTQLGKLYDFFTEAEMIQINEQQIRVQYQAEKPQEWLPFLLMFGSFVQVIQPKALKQAHYQAIQAMTTIYS